MDYKLILVNAIKHRNIDVIRYILRAIGDEYGQDWNTFINTNFDLLTESCFIYGYIEPLEVVWEVFQEAIKQVYSNFNEEFEDFAPKDIINIHIHMIKLKLGLPFTKLRPEFYDMSIDPTILLWESTTFCEYVVIYTVLSGRNNYFDKLTGKVEPKANYGDYRDLDNYMFLVASLVGKQKLTEIVNKYMNSNPEGLIEVKVYPEEYLKSLYGSFDIPFLSKYTDYISFGKLLFSPELAPQYIKLENAQDGVKVNLAAYYALSGLYDWYVSEILKHPQTIEEGLYLASADMLGSDLSFDLNGKYIQSAGYPLDSKLV